MTAGLRRLASAPVPVGDVPMQLTVFGVRDDDGVEHERIAALRTPAPQAGPRSAPLVRLHSACFTGDVLGSGKCDCGSQLAGAIDAIIDDGDGALLYLLDQEGRGIGLANKIRAYALQAAGHDTISANLALGLPVEDRDFSAAADCLRLLGMPRIRLLTNNPLKLDALRADGVVIESRVPLRGQPTRANRDYLATKDRAMGHLGAALVAHLPVPPAAAARGA